jgi:hypothetical protein
MYEAQPTVYEAYGATVLAWGGAPKNPGSVGSQALKRFGSVGMVTEFSRYHERFPEAYEQGLCRDLKGEPFKVPWLTDHRHKGVPYWWCCTRQPVFRQYISERVAGTVKAGVDGVHIDDHLGTAGALFVDGGCFCERCAAEFPGYLAALSPARLTESGISDPASYNFPNALRGWLRENPGRKTTEHPVWPVWRVYQLRGAAAFMGELRSLAERTAGKPVPMSANACLMWGPHLNDYPSLDFFSAEIEHHASTRALSDEPLAGYRIAQAVGRPLAATASGGDWAFVAEHGLHGIVQSWIALGYAAGNSLMAPNRQWCYTPQKGTHWYEGPREKFAPLYRFVRDNADLFEDFETHADLILAYAQPTFDRDRSGFAEACHRLAEMNLSFRLVLGGDEAVQKQLSPAELEGALPVVVLEPADFQASDRAVLGQIQPSRRIATVQLAAQKLRPAARALTDKPVRVFPRVKPGRAVVHIVNWHYVADKDSVEPVRDLPVELDLAALGVRGGTSATLFAPGKLKSQVKLRDGKLQVPELGLWVVIEVKGS